jgi:hypothetical protein
MLLPVVLFVNVHPVLAKYFHTPVRSHHESTQPQSVHFSNVKAICGSSLFLAWGPLPNIM